MGKIKVEHPTFFAAKIKVIKTFMAANLIFILENKSWGYKSQFQRNAYSLWSRQSQSLRRSHCRNPRRRLLSGPRVGNVRLHGGCQQGIGGEGELHVVGTCGRQLEQLEK